MKPTLSVRRTVYRNTPGWLICGRDRDGRNISVFMRYEDLARRMKLELLKDPVSDVSKVALWREYADRKASEGQP